MTERNITIMDRIVEEMASGVKLSKALELVYTKRNVAIPYCDGMFDTPVLSSGLPPRITNALMRARLKSIDEVVQFVEKKRLMDISNFGRTSCMELMEYMLDAAWEKMDKNERVAFLIDVVERNEENIRKELM